jgi:hypothetical protein
MGKWARCNAWARRPELVTIRATENCIWSGCRVGSAKSGIEKIIFRRAIERSSDWWEVAVRIRLGRWPQFIPTRCHKWVASAAVGFQFSFLQKVDNLASKFRKLAASTTLSRLVSFSWILSFLNKQLFQEDGGSLRTVDSYYWGFRIAIPSFSVYRKQENFQIWSHISRQFVLRSISESGHENYFFLKYLV